MSLDKEDILAIAHGDAAVTTFRFVIKIETEKGDVYRRCRTMNVWLKRDNHWQIIAGHNAVLDPLEETLSA